MVQVLQDLSGKRPSVGSMLAKGVGSAGQSLAKSYTERLMQGEEEAKKRAEIEEENEAILQETERMFGKGKGIRLHGIKDPKQREEAFKSALTSVNQQVLEAQKQENRKASESSKASSLLGLESEKQKNREALEKLKQGGKEDILKGKQSFLNEVLGGKKSEGLNPINEDGLKEHEPLDFSNISDEDIIRAEAQGLRGLREAKDAALKKISDEKKQKRSDFTSDREYHSKTSQPIIDKAVALIEKEPIDKSLIAQQRRDISTGNTEGIIPFLVEMTGSEVYRNPESARFKTASKQRFVESVHELGASGARANQFIEQQLVGAQATLGRSEEANQTVLDLEEFILDMKNQRAKYELEEAEKDNEKLGYVKNDISQRANKKMAEYAESRQNKMAYDIRERHENTLDDKQLAHEIISGKVSPDTPLTRRSAAILMLKNNDDKEAAMREALRLGFTLPRKSK